MGRTRGLPTARGASAPRVPCPALAPLTRAPGSAAELWPRVGALSAGSERAPHTALYNQREAPAAAVAAALPPLGPPRPRPPPTAPSLRPLAASPSGAAPLPRPWPEPPALVAVLLAAHAPCCGSPRLAPAWSRGRQSTPHPPRTVRSSLLPGSPLSPAEGLWTPRPAIRRCGRQPHWRAKRGPRQGGRGGGGGEQGCVATGGREPAEVADSDFVSQPLRDVNPQTLESLAGITTAKAAQSPGQRRPTARRAVE